MGSFTILLFVLAVPCLLAVVTVAILTADREDDTQHSFSGLNWRPPLGTGSRLMLWGARVSELVTRKMLGRRRNKATASRLAREVLAGASCAIRGLPHVDPSIDFADCRKRDSRPIGVTPPEVLAIADKIRPNAPLARLVRDRAANNLALLARRPGCETFKLLACPLRTALGTCAAGELCPLECRTTCQLTSGARPDDAAVVQRVARDLQFGIEVGLTRGLRAAELDNHIYELNSALATALETPDASEKWAQGEPVLEHCARKDYCTYVS